VRHLLDRRVLFFGGKGGVGKTTCAAAFALAASRAGRRTLLVSTDPAHSTSDVLETPLGPEAREILPGLAGLEIDAVREARRYVDEAKSRMSGLFGPAVLAEAARQIELTASMPGVADLAVFDRMSDLVLSRAGDYDLVVFDTAPTGHALQMLRLPGLLSSWVEALTRRRRAGLEAGAIAAGAGAPAPRSPDPVLGILEERSARLSAVKAEFARADRVAFVLVLIPERLPLEESVRAAHELSEAGIAVGGVIVNRVLPDAASGRYFEARKAQEQVYLEEIGQRMPPVPRVLVPQLESDVHGLDGLDRVRACLVAESAARG
jgi:arsenite/tail-anchored protein-transporting ATPase